MSEVQHHKVVAALPAVLQANAIYYVRSGVGFDSYVTNSTGMIVAYRHNQIIVENITGQSTTAVMSQKATTDAIAAATINKVDKEAGKGLSTNDYTTAEKDKLTGITAGAKPYTASTGLTLTGTAFSVNYGTAAGTAAQGNDVRINNGQTAFTWGNHASAGYIKSYVNTTYTASTGLTLTGTAFSVNYGTAAGTAAQGNDTRIVNASQNGHTHTWAQVTGAPATATRWPSLTEVTGKPTNYPTTWDSVASKPATATRWPTPAEAGAAPVSHTHTAAQVSGLGTAASRNVGTSAGQLMEVNAFGLGDAAYTGSFSSQYTGGNAFINSTGGTTPLGITGYYDRNTYIRMNSSNHYGYLMINDHGLFHSWVYNPTSVPRFFKVFSTLNQLAIGTTAATARTALGLHSSGTGWVDLRPYLVAPFYWDSTRTGNNSHPRARLLPDGKVELDGVVSYNATSAAMPMGQKIMRVPEPFRPRLTTGFVGFADSSAPLAFGMSSAIVFGTVDYSGGGRAAGDIALIASTGISSPVQKGALTLNSACWYVD